MNPNIASEDAREFRRTVRQDEWFEIGGYLVRVKLTGKKRGRNAVLVFNGAGNFRALGKKPSNPS